MSKNIKDRRYQIAKTLICCNEIKIFSDVLPIVPKSIIARDLGMHNRRFLSY